MIDQTQNMPDYFNKLPKEVQSFVADGVWEERTNEIAKKYSLNEAQTDELSNNVLYILIGLDVPDNFIQNIITDLSISNLLAEQIMEDLDNRVFDYALKQTEGAQTKKESGAVPENKKVVLPELQPNNLPMTEPGEVAHDVPHEYVVPQKSMVDVPRYEPRKQAPPPNIPTMMPAKEKPNVMASAISNKLNNITATNSSNEVVKKYEVDPYREPLG